MVLLGVEEKDSEKEAIYLAKKIVNLRIFCDENDKMNLSVKDINGKILTVSQFTLCADTSHGNRPSFTNAAKPEKAKSLYELFMEECRKLGIPTEHGEFGAHMEVELSNDGPVTIVFE